MLWYSRSRLSNHGSSQERDSASANFSSNHRFVIQSTPPISASEFAAKESRTKLQLSSNQSISASRPCRYFPVASRKRHWISSAPRSEERRVGKECRSRRSLHHE